MSGIKVNLQTMRVRKGNNKIGSLEKTDDPTVFNLIFDNPDRDPIENFKLKSSSVEIDVPPESNDE